MVSFACPHSYPAARPAAAIFFKLGGQRRTAPCGIRPAHQSVQHGVLALRLIQSSVLFRRLGRYLEPQYMVRAMLEGKNDFSTDMFSLDALMGALPLSSLEPQVLAFINGFGDVTPSGIWLLEPPASRKEPFVDPLDALAILLQHRGELRERAQALAAASYEELKSRLPAEDRVCYLETIGPDVSECVPAATLADFVREQGLVAADVAGFLDSAIAATRAASIFRRHAGATPALRLAELPATPLPEAMVEFMPALPWDYGEGDEAPARWRQSIRPAVARIETELGASVYYFADPDDEFDDDYVHRLLVLHGCCSVWPDSPFVRYLVRASGAESIEELKQQLLDPRNYIHPFRMGPGNGEPYFVQALRIDYEPPGRRRTVGIVFLAPEARDCAAALIRQRLGADVFLVAPEAVLPQAWLDEVLKGTPEWTVQYVHDQELREPVDLLARLDKLYVIGAPRSNGPGADMGVPQSIECLMWRAFSCGVSTQYFLHNGSSLLGLDQDLARRGIAQVVAREDELRRRFTAGLNEVRLDREYSSSGLWDSEGRMIGYDLLSLPFALVRRLSRWQRDFEEANDPCSLTDTPQKQPGLHEEVQLARDLQSALGSHTRVKLWVQDGWSDVADVPLP